MTQSSPPATSLPSKLNRSDRPTMSDSSDRPAVSDPGYVQFVRTKPIRCLPAEDLAADLRKASRLSLGIVCGEIARRLFCHDEANNYLRVVRNQSRKVPPARRDLQSADFTQQALSQIYKKLLSERGAYAEEDWDAFCYQCCLDAATELYGENQRKTKGLYAPEALTPGPDGEEDLPDPLGGLRPNDFPLLELETLVENVVGAIPDKELRLVARDQFGPDPSPVSGFIKTSKVEGKPSLLIQLGWEQTPTNRDRVYRLLDQARGLIAGEILRTIDSREIVVDLTILRDWLRKKKR